MADISKCEGHDCPIRNKCYRYTAPIGMRQAYMNHQHKDGMCEDYWDNENK